MKCFRDCLARMTNSNISYEVKCTIGEYYGATECEEYDPVSKCDMTCRFGASPNLTCSNPNVIATMLGEIRDNAPTIISKEILNVLMNSEKGK